MVCLAAWGESAGNGEEDDLLVRPFLAGIVFLGTTADGRVAVGDGCPFELDALGELVANLEEPL